MLWLWGVRAAMPSRCDSLRALLVWTVLTASTIGPGTVTMCSKSGADYGATLIWAVVISAAIALVLQEGSGRLTIASGKSLGEAVRALTPSGVPLLGRHLFAAGCVVGNFAYEANNVVGAMAAVEILLQPADDNLFGYADVNCSLPEDSSNSSSASLPTIDDVHLPIRQTINFLLWPLCLLVISTSTQKISLLCSAVVLMMLLCFLITLCGAGLPLASSILRGLLPSIPDGSAEVVLAVLGTTSIPVNILLGSSLARQSDSLGAMRKGVALASVLTGVMSLLIMMVGTRVPPHPSCVPFALVDVARVLQGVMGRTGLYGFGVGLFGAGLSSALTIPLGLTLTLNDLYGLSSDEELAASGEESAKRTRWRRRGVMCAFLGMSVVPALLVPYSGTETTILIITTAQVVNGVLLPWVAAALFISLNHASIVGGESSSEGGPQGLVLNCLMAPCVAIAVFLACVVLLKQSIGRAIGGVDGAHTSILAALPIAMMLMMLLLYRVRVVRGTKQKAVVARRRTAEVDAAAIEMVLASPEPEMIVTD